jgi:hypothetical protein
LVSKFVWGGAVFEMVVFDRTVIGDADATDFCGWGAVCVGAEYWGVRG